MRLILLVIRLLVRDNWTKHLPEQPDTDGRPSAGARAQALLPMMGLINLPSMARAGPRSASVGQSIFSPKVWHADQ